MESSAFYDAVRVMVVSSLMFLSGALLYTYVWQVVTDKRKRTPMFWGGLAAVALIADDIIEQVSRIGEPGFSYHLPFVIALVVFGMIALHESWKRGGE